MHHEFHSYLGKNDWFQNQEKGLVAVSGGRDSMVLCHLLLALKLEFGIGHCNFQLRGEESDEDQKFVKAFALEQGIPYFTANFDTEAFATEKKVSTQVAARDLRYEWLEKTRREENYDYILTAHHLNDSLETLLYNLSKGTGIRGLHGIPPQNGKIIRPLLFATRDDINTYTQVESIRFREDSSNSSTKYQRNLIRQEVVPVLKQINPSLEKTFGENISRFQEVEWLYEYAVNDLKQKLVTIDDDCWKIDFSGLANEAAKVSILFEWLRPYSFHPDQIEQVFAKNKTQSGRLFLSPSHELLVDRQQLILRPKQSTKDEEIIVSIDCENVALPEGTLKLNIFDKAPYSFPNDPNIAYFDFNALKFPLRLRRWQAGDSFQPFGMDGHHQKLQDYFNNAKLSRFEKEKVWILESGGMICWVIGYRFDERFRVGDSTGQVLKAQWLLNS